jgi:hypothetical protein
MCGFGNSQGGKVEVLFSEITIGERSVLFNGNTKSQTVSEVGELRPSARGCELGSRYINAPLS